MKSAHAARIAISLPRPLLLEFERFRKSTGLSRSGLIRQALVSLLASHQKAARVRAYVQGYKTHPETKRELDEALALSLPLLSEEPWK
jgi:metal-responsive CopG/Arc/MetJ family transcriptional regulator